jgi:large subunit ribosomal protein L15
VPDSLNLSNLKPAQKRIDRKRVGRGQGSGKGRYSGRGLKGQKSRSGSAKMRPGFEGGQMPIYMRLGKKRGPYSRDAMPVGPFRTLTYSVNVRDLEKRFESGTTITPDELRNAGLIRSTSRDVKILGEGDLTKSLAVHAHGFSKTAKEKIERAGGSVVWLRGEPLPKVRKQRVRKPVADEEPEVEEAAADADEAPEASAEESEPEDEEQEV